MASKKIKGIVIEIGGDTSKLSDALKDTEKKTSALQSELREVERALKFNPDNVELLAQKQKLLTDTVEETTNKLEILRKAEEQVVEQFKKGDIGEDQLRAFQREIIETQSKLDHFESELDSTVKSVENVGKKAEESGEGFTIMKGALADLVSNAIQNAVTAIGDFVGSLLELSEATEEYRTMQAKLEGSANTFGYSINFAKDKYEEFYQYLGDDQASTNAITNLMGVGTSTESLSKLVEGATGAWATYGDSINVESLTEAINETITCGKVTGSFADTINWCKDANENLKTALDGNNEATKAYNDALKEGLPVEDAFNEALAKITDEQERADVVAQFLNITYGESKKAYDDLNKSVMDTNSAELELKETQAQLGETLSPVNNALTDMKNQALEAITPLVEKLATEFLNLLTWLKEHPGAMKAITAVVITLATAFTILAGVLAIQGIINGVATAIAFLNTTMLANPIVLFVALLAGLVAGFLYLWNNCERFRLFWIAMWEGLKIVAGLVKDALVEFFTVEIPKAWEDFKNKTQSVIDSVSKFFENLKTRIATALHDALVNVLTWISNTKTNMETGIRNTIDAVVSWFNSIPTRIKTALSNAISSVVSWGATLATKGREAGSKLLNAVVDKVREIGSKMLSIGGDIVSGLWSGINDKVAWLKGKISGFVGDVTGWLKNFFKIESPSRLMRDEIGRYIAEGIGVGIVENEDKPLSALEQLGNDMVNYDINGATINRKLNTTFSNGGIKNNNDNVLSKLDNIYEKLGRLQVVLDTGILVGETIDKIDAGLATKQSLRARGV